MTTHRVTRGRRTQELTAQWFRDHGWPAAKSRAASLPGADVYDIPFCVEVKATESISFPAALRQASANAGDLLPLVVYRPRGFGPEKQGDWLAVFTLRDATQLLQSRFLG